MTISTQFEWHIYVSSFLHQYIILIHLDLCRCAERHAWFAAGWTFWNSGRSSQKVQEPSAQLPPSLEVFLRPTRVSDHLSGEWGQSASHRLLQVKNTQPSLLWCEVLIYWIYSSKKSTRDTPDSLPSFVGENEAKKGYAITQMGDNAFAAVLWVLTTITYSLICASPLVYVIVCVPFHVNEYDLLLLPLFPSTSACISQRGGKREVARKQRERLWKAWRHSWETGQRCWACR